MAAGRSQVAGRGVQAPRRQRAEEETPGDKVRTFVGDGDRSLKVGGQRIFVLVDASSSMLDETIVNIIRRRNLPGSLKIRATTQP